MDEVDAVSSNESVAPSKCVAENKPSMPANVSDQMAKSSHISQQGVKLDKSLQHVHASVSSKNDVFHQYQDVWKPSRLNPEGITDNETKKTEALNRAVRSILNKLTPEKFPILIEKIKSLPIDTVSRMEGVVDLIRQKAINEPGYCRWYAEVCKAMQSLSVPNESTGVNETFRKILLYKCQRAVELDSKLFLTEIEAYIEAHNDPGKKKQLLLEFEKMERERRRKSVGNYILVGELFNLQMLTTKIVLRLVIKLISNREEESMECLCKLLTTIGKNLEIELRSVELDKFFSQMQEVVNDKENKVSCRIRFMLEDVIDLRKNKWVPRRKADIPKTIDEINREFERQERSVKPSKVSTDNVKQILDDLWNQYDAQQTMIRNNAAEIAKLQTKIDEVMKECKNRDKNFLTSKGWFIIGLCLLLLLFWIHQNEDDVKEI